MREILYKAKLKDWRELPKEAGWVEGYYAMMGTDNIIRHYIVQNCAITRLFKNPEDNMYFNDVEIDPETLCQYICMNDNNGKKIWENDIVSCEHEKYPEDTPLAVYPLFPDPIKYKRNYTVEFVNTGSSYGYRLRNKSIHFMLTGNVIYNHKIEVIGNIFDNPELLGQGGEDH